MVRYNPRNPADAILWVPSYDGVIASFAIGGVILGLSVVLQLAG